MIKRILFLKAAVLMLFIAAHPAGADYNLMVASCREKASADTVVEELSRLNFTGYIADYTVKGKGRWHRVYVGPFATKAQAFEQREKLMAAGYRDEVLVLPVEQRAGEGKAGALPTTTAAPAAAASVSKQPETTAEKTPPAGKTAALTEGFGIQIGAFTDLQNAKNYLDNLHQKGQPAYMITENPASGPAVHKVGIGPFAQQSQAQAMQGELKQMGFSGDFPVVAVNLKSGGSPPAADEKQSAAAPSDTGTPPASGDMAEKTASAQTPADETPSKGDTGGGFVPVIPLSSEITPTEEALAKIKPAIPDANVLSAGDLIHIEIPGQKEMSQDYDLDPEGNIYLIIVGKVEAAGMTLEQFSQILRQKVRRFIKRGDEVAVNIVKSMRYIHIRGGVRYPGWYRVDVNSSFKEIIDMTGGLLTDIDPALIRLLRWNGTQFESVDISGEFDLLTNDVLAVPTPRVFKQKLDMGDLLFLRVPEERSAVQGVGSTAASGFAIRTIQVEVDKNGFIHVPGHGHIYVNGLTTDEIERILSEELPKYISRSAKVGATIIEKKHYIQVLGHVLNPGVYNISEAANVQAALSAAGGAVDGAVMSEVHIIRNWGGKERKVRVNLYQFTITGDSRLLPPLHDNDVLFVPITAAFGAVKRTLSQWEPPQEKLDEEARRKVRVFGAVNRPGVFEPSDHMNLLDSIIMAQGNRDDADMGNILLIRENKAFKYNLNAILDKRKSDSKAKTAIPAVQAGDSVYVTYVEKTGYQKQDPKRQIRVLGAVWHPGTFDAQIDLNLLDALSLAHGLRDDARRDDIRIVRKDRVERYDMDKLFADYKRKRGYMPKVGPGETVMVGYVEKTGYQETEPIYVVGEVRSPGVYDLADGGMTVLQMLAMAGGLGEWADKDGITIIRMVDGKQENIRFNYDRAIEGKYPEMNIRLQKNDTIYIP